MTRWNIGETEATGFFNSQPGGMKEKYVIVRTTNGKNRRIAECPTKDMAMKVFQTLKHDLRESAKKNTRTTIRLMSMIDWSDNGDMNWVRTTHKTINTAEIRPYSKRYSARMKRIRGF
jgi:hypothetical protein